MIQKLKKKIIVQNIKTRNIYGKKLKYSLKNMIKINMIKINDVNFFFALKN